MKIFIFIAAFMLQGVFIALSSPDWVSQTLGNLSLVASFLLALFGIIKCKSKLAYLPLLSSLYLLFFFIYYLLTKKP